MATIASLGYNTQVSFSTFTGEVTSLSVSSSREQIDVTHMNSPNSFKEFIAALRDPGEITLEMNFDPTQPDPQELGRDTLAITWPNGTTWSYDDAECTGYDITAPVAEQMTSTATFKLSGEKTVT